MGYMQAKPMGSRAAAVQMSAEATNWKAAGLAAALAIGAGVQGASAGPFTRSEIASLTYEQIKGTGLANTCPIVEGASEGAKISITGGKKYKIDEFCLEVRSAFLTHHASPLSNASRLTHRNPCLAIHTHGLPTPTPLPFSFNCV